MVRTILVQHGTYAKVWLMLLLIFTLTSSVLMGCSSSNNTSVPHNTPTPQAPESRKCDARSPNRDDVTILADNCGVSALEITRNIPKAPEVGIVQIDLYIEQHDPCGIVNILCGIGDNRPFVAKGEPDPRADPSRNRAHIVFDFRNGQMTLQVAPSCRIHSFGVGWDRDKECFAPWPEGNGTDLEFNVAPNGTVDMKLTLHEANYNLHGLCDLYNHFSITPHQDTGNFSLTGEGGSFPDLAIIQNGQVVVADQTEHLSALCVSPVYKRTYQYPMSSTQQQGLLTSVDWSNFTYTTSCLSSNLQQITTRDGKFPTDDPFFVVHTPPVYGDLDGDGQLDAVLSYDCIYASIAYTLVIIYTGNATHPVWLGELPVKDGKFVTVDSVSINQGVILLTGWGYSPNNPNYHNLDLRVKTSYRWKGGNKFYIVSSEVTKL